MAFALVLMLADWEETIYKTLVTTTLIIVLFTIVVLGGSTLPILKVLHTELPLYEVICGLEYIVQ